ncbi:hypothetical protein [Paraburkholderia sp. MM5384-R2]|uniref:hypothetical protein n=1 Tax=Paraburkholderia sp. MM5384-R2 TaxID=2723097 RepID=UPI0016193A3E|nr:hypothetical protein [Paraburkholderia sp. MM5384-R2]MBB5502769.1 hypothetical protein [Paraburkholderia sp. MM5384-R2]
MDNSYGYYVALTDALEQAKEARDETSFHGDSVPAVEFLAATKMSQAGFACARRYIEGYTQSKNKGIRDSAQRLSTALQSLQSAGHLTERGLTAAINGTNVAQGTQAQQTANAVVLLNDGWQGLYLGVAASSLAAFNYDNNNKRFAGVALSAAQREDIIRRLQAFGPGVEHEDHSPPLETSIAMLLNYFRNTLATHG